MRHIQGYLILPVLLVSFVAVADQFSGRCIRVQDGDLITVVQDSKEVAVRLYGIDAPESRQPYGPAAKKRLSDLVRDKTLTVDITETDRFGKVIGRVFLPDKTDINLLLVAEGLAWATQQTAELNTELHEAQAKAQASRLGLWQVPQPTPPWEFRRGGTRELKVPDGKMELDLQSPSPRQYVTPPAPYIPPAGRRADFEQNQAAGGGVPFKVETAETFSKTTKGSAKQSGPAKTPSASQGSARQPARKPAPTPESVGSNSVYITDTGVKFHNSHCRHLDQSKYPISRSAAIAQGYTACKVCGGE